MSNVDFPSRNRNVSLNLTYGGLTSDDVGIEIITPYGDLGGSFSERTIAEIHESLGAYLTLRKKARKEERDRKRTSARDVQKAPRGPAGRGDGG